MSTVVFDLNFKLFFCDGIDEVYMSDTFSYGNRYLYATVYFPNTISVARAKEILQEVKNELQNSQ